MHEYATAVGPGTAAARSEAATVQWRAVLDAMPAQIVIVDRHGVITAANAHWRLTALRDSDQPGQPAQRTEPGVNYLQICADAAERRDPSAQAAVEGIRAVLEGDSASFCLDYRCDAPCAPRWFRMSVTPLAQPVGSALIMHTETTERERAQSELRVSEQRLRLATDAAGLGVFDIDLLRDTEYWDETARRLYCFAPDEPVALARVMQRLHPEDAATARARMQAALRGSRPDGFCDEYRVIDSAGGVHHLAVQGRTIFDRDRIVRFVGIVADVSDRKLREQEQSARRREMRTLLTTQVAALSAVAFAHKLNQPLGAISAYSDAALRMLQAGNPDPDGLVRALQATVVQSQRAGATFHALLNSLRADYLTVQSFDLHELLLEAIADSVEDGFGGFMPVLDVPPGLPAVQGDRRHLKKVLLELIANSVEAMAAGTDGPATIEFAARRLADGSAAQVTLRDNGPGVPAELEPRIFEQFFTSKSQRIGLGLAISRALVEGGGGRLWFDAQTRPGAAFHFTVPFAP